MEIKQTALAGTLESSDLQVMVTNGNDGIQIELESDVKKQFGAQIKATITAVLQSYDIEQANVRVVDKGALDMVIKARTIAAVQRALDIADQPTWEVI